MNKHLPKTWLIVLYALLAFNATVLAQKPKAAAPSPKTMVFAVLNDGATLEPIAEIVNGKLKPSVNGSDDNRVITAFNKAFYKSGTTYRLVFGGANSGSVAVKSSDSTSECAKNLATATTKANKTPLRGFVMGLATNAAIKSTTPFRRRPTADEKEAVEALVRAAFAAQKLTPEVLRYHNLTAMDFDSDGTPEMVGSYWIEVDKNTRALLFFIAAKDSKDKYFFGYHDYRTIDQAGVMSGEIKAVDEGVYHELLLDVFDYDGDGTREVFTYVQSFEGSGFNVYRRKGSKWTKEFDGSNYHCGF